MPVAHDRAGRDELLPFWKLKILAHGGAQVSALGHSLIRYMLPVFGAAERLGVVSRRQYLYCYIHVDTPLLWLARVPPVWLPFVLESLQPRLACDISQAIAHFHDLVSSPTQYSG